MDDLPAGKTPYQHMLDLMPAATEAQRRARLGTLGFSVDKADTRAENLSGGEKARLLFALATFHGAHLLILDEPTNHLDVDAREALVRALNDYEGAVILITHDRHLIEACADRLWIVRDGTVRTYDGDMDDYRARVPRRARRPDEAGRQRPRANGAAQAHAAGDAAAGGRAARGAGAAEEAGDEGRGRDRAPVAADRHHRRGARRQRPLCAQSVPRPGAGARARRAHPRPRGRGGRVARRQRGLRGGSTGCGDGRITGSTGGCSMFSRRLGRSIPFAILHLLVAAALAQAALPASGLAASLEQLMADGHVPGVAMAIINNGEIVDVTTAGVRNVTSKAPVDGQTIFEAASLSKPVFAYAVLQLIDAGVLSLDEPLSKHVPDYVPKDPRAAEITVRQALSHTSGLPNFRSEKWPLKTHFAPAERYSYSSEGFMWLQRVVEAATGEHIEDLLQRLVFRPLGMRNSSLVWRPAFDSNYAEPHDATPALRPKRKPPVANAAATLQTTAIDYARFLQAVLRGRRLKPETARLWLAPQVRVRNACFQCLAPDLPDVETHVAWGLGWGLEPRRARSSTGATTAGSGPTSSARSGGAGRSSPSPTARADCRSCRT